LEAYANRIEETKKQLLHGQQAKKRFGMGWSDEKHS
jgi:hypothetical protein